MLTSLVRQEILFMGIVFFISFIFETITHFALEDVLYCNCNFCKKIKEDMKKNISSRQIVFYKHAVKVIAKKTIDSVFLHTLSYVLSLITYIEMKDKDSDLIQTA